MKIRNKKLIIPISIAVVLSLVGTVGALNGWFGGGGSIPSDTFTRGLVGYWSFDEGGGQYAYDASDNSNTGTLGSAATAGADDPKWTTGKVAGALKFDGVDDYVYAGNDSSLLPDIVSAEAWVKYDGSGTYAPLVAFGGNLPGFYVELNNRPLLYLGGSNYRYFSATNPVDIY
jgi:hypothetical protein